MIRTESYTSVTNDLEGKFGGSRQLAVAIALITIAGLWLRSLRIEWQPLWWDEGYSVFFATEPIRSMMDLTAADIHPPLYYALLHAWIRLFGSAQPAVIRYESVLIGALTLPAFGLMAHTLFPRRRDVVAVAVLLLAVNPMHIFYSQEVRMYALALLLGIAATICVVRLSTGLGTGRPAILWAVTYVGFAALLIHTLYYGAFLIAGHAVWAVWRAVRLGRGLGFLALMYAALVLICMPWWLYAAPKLAAYVTGKVQSDQDEALTPWVYVFRHLVAFGGGHLPPGTLTLDIMRRAVPVLLILALWLALRDPDGASIDELPESNARHALAIFAGIPALLAYGANLRFPFFPEAGERLLLFVLPYLLLLVAAAVAPHSGRSPLRRLILLALLLIAGIGVTAYYTIPRYHEHDYRPIVADVTQNGTDSDSVLALFPWQVGYWRSYTPQAPSGTLYLPQPAPVGQAALEWTPALREQITNTLAHGVLWFPEPRSFGSQLPSQSHDYLRSSATNLVETWYGDATLLTAWTEAPIPELAPVSASWGQVSLVAAGVEPTSVASANQPIVVRLAWQLESDAAQQHVVLRLEDREGRTWASRDYEPIGNYATGAAPGTGQVVDQIGLIVPVGLPPGSYDLVVGVRALVDATEAEVEPEIGRTVRIAELDVLAPAELLPVVRMPIDFRFAKPAAQGPARLLGFSGIEPETVRLAGTALAVQLAYQSVAPARSEVVLSLSLVDTKGDTSASYRGWPLPDYPVQRWQPGALVTVPAELQTPADMAAGTYSLYGGLVPEVGDPTDSMVKLADIQIVRRPTTTERGSPQFTLDPPVQFGSHAELYGYDLTRQEDKVHLVLYWSVLQSLLPPHHIFVHLDAPDDTTLAQADGPPRAMSGSAPTGTWLPGEQLATDAWLELPDEFDGVDLNQLVLRVGLYEPISEARLPASRGGMASGDYAELPLAP